MRGAGVAVALLVVAAASCSSSSGHAANVPSTTSTTLSMTTTTSVPAGPVTPEAASATSPVLVRKTWTVIATYVRHTDAGTPGRIDVLEWKDGWRVAASFEQPPAGVPEHAEPGRPRLVVDLTGDGEPDFLLPLEAASTAPYVVVSNDGGQWRRVQFGDDVIITEPDAPTAGPFVTTKNLCDPSCAAGHVEREAWKYSPTNGRFERTDSAICDPLANGRVRCDKPTSPLASVRPLDGSLPAVWVTPSTGIPPARSLTVGVIGFPPGAKVFVSQCTTPSPMCGGQLAAQRFSITDDGGAATLAFTPPGRCSTCVIEVTTGPDGPSVSKQIGYA
jgi:hypothetical protein